jgi:hypothetical protein
MTAAWVEEAIKRNPGWVSDPALSELQILDPPNH